MKGGEIMYVLELWIRGVTTDGGSLGIYGPFDSLDEEIKDLLHRFNLDHTRHKEILSGIRYGNSFSHKSEVGAIIFEVQPLSKARELLARNY